MLGYIDEGSVRAVLEWDPLIDADGELSARRRLVLDMAYNHLRYLEGRLAALDRYLLAAMQPYAWAWRLLQTIPGIDAVSAAMILIEIGDDPHRFGSPARLASWSALCPGNNESAGKRKSGKTRHGNSANAARRTKTVFRAKYESLVIRRGHKKTIIALAHKLVRTIYFVLVRRKPFRDSTVDYEAASVAKNAPRWIRALKKYGYWPQVAAPNPLTAATAS